MEDSAISAILKELRQRAGLTQEALSKELHISRQVYSCYETGKRLPDIDTVVKICCFYHISVDQLLYHVHSSVPEPCQQFLKSYGALNPDNQKAVNLYMQFLKNQEKYT